MEKSESKITPENITELQDNQIFVFGSNLSGNHAGGAAKLASEKFGAETGIGEGLTGQSYALPTLDEKLQQREIDDIKTSVDLLLEVAKSNTDKHFIITEIGCGIAGYDHQEIGPMFKDFYLLDNISLPQKFIDCIVVKGFKGFHAGMKCGGLGGSVQKQYSENTVFEEDLNPVTCSKGMHFCEMPLDVFGYYPPVVGAEYAEVEAFGSLSREESKTATNKLKVKGKITISGLFKAHFDIIRETVKKAVQGVNTTVATEDNSHASASGNYGHASASGDEAIACTLGIQARSRASKGWIVLVDWRQDEDYNWYIKDIFRAKVGKHKVKGQPIQPDTWYWMENGELKSQKP